jgi:hypothetical protein
MRRTVHRRPELGTLHLPESEPAESPWWSRLLDGARQWGSFDATVGRYGVQRYRLTVYPPGVSTSDRRFARLRQGWPITGAVLGLLAIMLLGNDMASPNAVLAWAVVAYVSIGAALFLRAGPARVQARSMSIILMPNGDDARERSNHVEWQALVYMLTRADQMVKTGVISRVEHEAVWWEAYDRLEAITHV